jgi:hypothetical protein
MPLTSFSQWDGTDESANTDLNDIPLQENRTRPSHVNGLFREMMKQLKAALGSVGSVPFTAASASGPASLEFAEDTDNGAHKVTLKAPASVAADVDVTLPGAAGTLATLTGTETLTNKTLTDPAIIGTILEDVFTITDGAAFEVDPGNGSMQEVTLTANRTPKATNFASGESVTLRVADGSAFTITWTDATWGGSGVVWRSGSAPTLPTTGWAEIELWKRGTQVYGAHVGDFA